MKTTTPEPKNHVIVLCAVSDTIDDETEIWEEKTHFSDVDDPAHLPCVARCDQTIDEWAAWKHWDIDRRARKAKSG